MPTNIAIDGPAGAGKSTIAKRVAKELSFIYVDTGAMYRAMALYLLKHEIPMEDAEAIAESCQDASISIRYKNGEQQVILNGENVTALLRAEEVGNMASVSSANPSVRKKLVSLQQELAASASSRTRAMRRYQELQQKGETCDLDAIEADIKERDYRDMHREISPLRQAEDAVLVDSSEMTIQEVCDAIIAVYEEKK